MTLGCGSSGGDGSSTTEQPGNPPPTDPTDPNPPPAPPSEPPCDETFDSTFDAIQNVIFEGKGCTAEACHGSAAAGGLDLSPDVAYANLFEAPSTASELSRVHPGTKERSFLWWKLLAAADDSVQVAGSPMPLAADPLSDDEFELLRIWIQSGAPETGTVLDSEGLVDGCLPDPEPITIDPLEPPAPDEGVQLVMPRYTLPASSELEVCFASYFDFSDVVPDEFKSEDGAFFYYDAFEIRQDPTSHHLLVQAPTAMLQGEYVDPSAVSGWACVDGQRDGEPCDPLDPAACGEGFCATPVENTTACIGYSAAPTLNTQSFTGTQQAQFRSENHPGVFSRAPIRGVVFWNSHAFNLTTKDHRMNARVNYQFATDQRFRSRNYGGFANNFGIPLLISRGAPPYTERELCQETVLPRGARLTALNSHTHKRGKQFTYTLPSGEVIYESFVYNDPLHLYFDPPLAFDSEDDAERTIRYCSVYNTGLDADGNPDPETVTRASRIPYGIGGPGSSSRFGLCEPTRCVNEGMYDVECDDGVSNQAGDDAACDSSPGAGDGFCDACQIMGGVTTENEMFGPSISYFVQE